MIEWYWAFVAGVAGIIVGACSSTAIAIWALKASQ